MAKTPDVPDVLVGDAAPAPTPPVPAVPAFEIAERRAQHGDLSVLREIEPSAALIHQPEPMMTRWIYTGPGAEGRFEQITGPYGYVPVQTRELASAPTRNGWNASPEGVVTRGEKGYEVLVKMPKRLYHQIQLRKAVDGDTRRRSPNTIRQHMAEELGREGNHRGADAAMGLRTTLFEETADVRKL